MICGLLIIICVFLIYGICSIEERLDSITKLLENMKKNEDDLK